MRTSPIAAAIAVVLALPSSAAEADKPASPEIKTVHCGRPIDADAGKLLGDVALQRRSASS